MRRSLQILLAASFLMALLSGSGHAAVDPAATGGLFEEAALAREEAARIWDELGERIRAGQAWAEAAASWEKAAEAYEKGGDRVKAEAARKKFRSAVVRRDQAEIILESVTGLGQKVRVTQPSAPLVVRVTDKTGRPIAGLTVAFEISARPGASDNSSLEIISPVTDSSGRASARVRAGTLAGNLAVSVTVPSLSRTPVVFEIEIAPGPAAKLQIAGGNNQVLRVNQKALSPLVVKVTDLYGNGVENIAVSYRIVSEPEEATGHQLSAEEAFTDAAGLCGVRFQSGSVGGSYVILVECGDLEGSPSKFEQIVRQTIPTLRVTGVVLEGIRDSGTLMIGSRFKVNETYLSPELSRLCREELKRLYSKGRFDDVSISLDQTSEADGVIIIRVEERPKVTRVQLTGMKKMKEADLRGTLGVTEGAYYSAAAVARARQALLDHMSGEGYLQAQVTVESTVAESPEPDLPDTVALVFRIDEKTVTKIARMNLHGNKHYSDWNLNLHMKTGAGKIYKQAEFEADRQKIMSRYFDKGFLSASMEDPVISFDEKGRMILDINMSEGPQYRVGVVSFTGNTTLTSERLLAMLKPLKGDIFRGRKFFESIEKMRLATARFGYAEARFTPQEKLDPQRGIVDFLIKVEEGPILYLEDIVIEGNFKTMAKVISREVHLETGSVLNGEELDKARRRLEQLGFFEPGSIRLDLREGSAADRRVLQVKVAEGKTGQLQFGAGYSSADRFVGFASISKKNFNLFDFPTFTGAGQDLTFSAEYGGKKNSFNVSFTEPYFRNKPISLGLDAFNTFQERDGYDWRRRGGALRLSHKFGEFGRMAYKYEGEQYQILNVGPVAPIDIQKEAGFPASKQFTRTTTSLTTAYTHDNRDDFQFPTSGHNFELSNQMAASFLGGNVAFNRTGITYSHFKKVISTHIFATRLQYGTLTNFFDKLNPVPAVERFQLGGSNSVRGYPERSIQIYDAAGVQIGPGKSFANMNFEYRVPFTEDKSISAVAFFDAGGVFSGEFSYLQRQMVYGTGLGIRFNTPLGPIRLDYGYGLNAPHKYKTILHFAVGQMF